MARKAKNAPTAGIGEPANADPVAGLEGPAVDMGKEDAEEGVTDGEASQDGEGAALKAPDDGAEGNLGADAQQAKAQATAEADQPVGDAQEATADESGGAEAGETGAGAGDTADTHAAADDDVSEEHSHLVGEEEPEYQANVLRNRARRAAADAFVNVAHEIGVLDQLDGDEHERPEFTVAADFLLAHEDADAAVIPVHLALQGIGGSMTPDATETMLWGVFADVFRRVHAHLVALVVLKFVVEESAGSMDREQAFKPQPGPFQPAGLTARG